MNDRRQRISEFHFFKHDSNNWEESRKDALHMSNGGSSVLINTLCLSGGRLAKTESQKLGWETLTYEPNEDTVTSYLDGFQKLIERMTLNDVDDAVLQEWLDEADADDPVNCGYPKCEIHDAYLSCHGCQVCTD